MKKLLAFSFLVLSIFVRSQTLTQTYNEPKVGDSDPEFLMDTTDLTVSMPISVTGSNCVWNFTALTTSTLIFNNYLAPSAVPSASAYTGCSVVQQSGPSYTFIKSVATPSAQTELLGLTLPLGSVNFTNSGIAARYPMSYGFTLSDNVAGAFTSTITNGACSGNLTTAVDGLGTINLPQGKTFSNVLRVKTVLNLSLLAGFIPIATVKQTIYSYYHISEKFPVLNINYTSMQITGSTSPTISASVSGNANIITGLKNTVEPDNLSFSVFPNPAKDVLHLSLPENYKTGRIKIYNNLSQLVFEGELAEKIYTEQLIKGYYYIELQSGSLLVRRSFIKN
ncbi:MAG: T9SS type A sorting domain-containing protein [Bacteroidia bacterium]|nr:T9SS type A sorting domain-containing protein [Bacteroidia bacterium]